MTIPRTAQRTADRTAQRTNKKPKSKHISFSSSKTATYVGRDIDDRQARLSKDFKTLRARQRCANLSLANTTSYLLDGTYKEKEILLMNREYIQRNNQRIKNDFTTPEGREDELNYIKYLSNYRHANPKINKHLERRIINILQSTNVSYEEKEQCALYQRIDPPSKRIEIGNRVRQDLFNAHQSKTHRDVII